MWESVDSKVGRVHYLLHTLYRCLCVWEWVDSKVGRVHYLLHTLLLLPGRLIRKPFKHLLRSCVRKSYNIIIIIQQMIREIM